MKKVALIIEKGEEALWGRVTVNDNLITTEAGTINELETELHRLIFEFEGIKDIEFEKYYDVFALFEEFDFINISKFAKYADINPGQLRQYASGVKHPREAQAKKIEQAFHKLSKEINKIAVYY